ncbi:hypothetical protein DD606_04695 [Enterobacter cloacae complex sp. GF14B]|nr:hypothetical protein DD606_04695 [Enterobacter cloacae complex sp. GF14B]
MPGSSSVRCNPCSSVKSWRAAGSIRRSDPACQRHIPAQRRRRGRGS